jgi:hypothetical protein
MFGYLGGMTLAMPRTRITRARRPRARPRWIRGIARHKRRSRSSLSWRSPRDHRHVRAPAIVANGPALALYFVRSRRGV